jgi:hypothetical protein
VKITPKETNIAAIFSSNFLVIPRFQRPYSWDKDNIQDFWEDIFASKPNDYFFGSMVMFRASESSAEAFVVDGQQRLTTVTVFLCVLRDALIGLSEKALAEGIQQIIERRDINNKLTFTLNAQDPYPFFQDHIQKMGKQELSVPIGNEEQALKECYDDLKAKISDHLNGKKRAAQIKELQKLRDRALAIKAITIDLDNEDDAYYIFETLNTRGKDLGTADLVKNLVLRLVKPTSGVDSARERWKTIQRTIGHSNSDISLNTFIVHHWISKFEYLPERKVFPSMRRRIIKSTIGDYYDSLCEEVRYYRGIFEPSFLNLSKEASEIFQALRVFSIFRLRQAAPFALALLSEFFNKEMSLKNAAKFLKAIENFHMKFTAITSQRGAGGVAKMYSRAARDLRNAPNENAKRKGCQELVDRYRNMQPDEPAFLIGFNDVLFSKEYSSQRALVRYILERIHRHSSNQHAVNYEEMTIEHLLSQESGHASEETKASLGNLIFVARKTHDKLKTKPFIEKRKILKDNNVFLDPVILAASKWGKAEIEKRQQYLGQLAYREVWKVL